MSNKNSKQNINYNEYIVYESDQTFPGKDFHKSVVKKPRLLDRLGIVGRLRVYFIGLTLIFFIVASAVFLWKWIDYFINYTEENLDTYSSVMTSDLRHIYMEEGCWNQRVEDYIDLFGFTRVGVAAMVKDKHGDVIAYSMHEEEFNKYSDKDAFIMPDEESGNVRENEIVIDSGEVVGYLNLWLYADPRLAYEDDLSFMLEMFSSIFIALIVSLIIAIALSLLVVKWLSDPFKKLVYAAKEIGKGNLSHRVKLQGNDEFALMGKTFDEMAQSLEKTQKIERQLTHDIAHELKTPLASMQATIEALIDGVYEVNNERLNIIHLEIKRMTRLVGAILNLSKLENRKININMEVFDFSDLARKCARFHQALFIDSGIDYQYSVEGEYYIKGDKDLILEAITNLISNAFRYTPEGGKVKVHTQYENGFVRFIVNDTGIGIAEEDKEKLFMRFFRTEDASKLEECGSGIGLPIVKEIVDMHNGWIAVKSELGKGSCFIIGLPIVDKPNEG